jgi:membrane protease YdiL (CAAX protease family)
MSIKNNTEMQNLGYFDQAKNGKNSWWRYVLGIIIVIFFAQFIGSIPFTFLLVYYASVNNVNFDIDSEHLLEQVYKAHPILSNILLNVTFIFSFVAIWLVVKLLHKRNFVTLITPAKKINFKKIMKASLVWMVFMVFSNCIAYLISLNNPEIKYEFNIGFFSNGWGIVFIFFSIFLTFFQTTFEELFFRGYLAQWISLKFSKLVTLIFTSLIFGSLHLFNPENSFGIWLSISYFLSGVFLAGLVWIDDSLETAIGVHWANNWFFVAILSSTNSVLPVTGVIKMTLNSNYKYEFVPFLIDTILILVMLFGFWYLKSKKQISKLNSVKF